MTLTAPLRHSHDRDNVYFIPPFLLIMCLSVKSSFFIPNDQSKALTLFVAVVKSDKLGKHNDAGPILPGSAVFICSFWESGNMN